MKKIKHILLGLIISSALLVTPVVSSSVSASPVSNFAACASGALLTFPAWYRGLSCNNGAVDISKTESGKDIGINGVWIIGLNVLNILIQVAGYAALGYIIWGGFKYIKSQGDPAKITEARNAIMNAVIGLVIAIASIGIVQLIASNIN